MAGSVYDDAPCLSAYERRRWLLWLALCQKRAVVPWVRLVARLAQAAEEDVTYRGALATLARLEAEIAEHDQELFDHDPNFAWGLLKHFYALKPDGTPDWTRRLR